MENRTLRSAVLTLASCGRTEPDLCMSVGSRTHSLSFNFPYR